MKNRKTVRRDAFKRAAAQKINPAVDAVGKRFAPRGLFGERRYAAVPAKHDAVFGRVYGGGKDDGRLRTRIEMRAERTFERKVEHRIACEDGDGIAQPVERLPDRARRTQRRRFAEIADVQPRRTQRLDLLGAEHRRHRNAGDPAIAQCVKDTLNGGPAAIGTSGLGLVSVMGNSRVPIPPARTAADSPECIIISISIRPPCGGAKLRVIPPAGKSRVKRGLKQTLGKMSSAS